MKLLTQTIIVMLLVVMSTAMTYALPLSDKVVAKEVVTTVDPPATTTDVAPVLTKKEKKAQRKMEKMQKRMEKFMPSSADGDSKTAAIIAYITLIGFLVSLLALHKKGDEFSAFHLRQSLGIGLVGLVGAVILGLIPVVGWILLPLWSLLILVLWIIGLIGAVNGTKKEVFLFGKAFQKWFSGIS